MVGALVADEYTRLKFKSNMAGLAFLILAFIYFAIWSAWLWPTFPYPGVAWDGLPWVNFRQWILLTIIFGSIGVYVLAWRAKLKKDIREIYGQKPKPEQAPLNNKPPSDDLDAKIQRMLDEALELERNKPKEE